MENINRGSFVNSPTVKEIANVSAVIIIIMRLLSRYLNRMKIPKINLDWSNIEVTGAMADMASACTAPVVGNWKEGQAQVACHLAAAERA